MARLHDRFRECLSSSETADLLIGKIVQLRIKLPCVRPLQFTWVEISGLDDAKLHQFPLISFSLSAHSSMKGMINFTSQVFPRQIMCCSDRGKKKSKNNFSLFHIELVLLTSLHACDSSDGQLLHGIISEIIHIGMWQYAHLLATRLKRVERSRPLSAAWAIDNFYEARVN